MHAPAHGTEAVHAFGQQVKTPTGTTSLGYIHMPCQPQQGDHRPRELTTLSMRS
jgi:hypothetical protein